MRIVTFILFIFLTTPVWSMGHLSEETVNNPLIGKSAPDAVLAKSDGTSASVVGSRKGKREILIFWATWCPNCYEELGTINDNIASIEQKGIKVTLIDLGETAEGVKNYFNVRHMKLVSFVDADSVLQDPYRLKGIPTLIFIDEKGIIRSVTHEFPSDYESQFSVK